MNSSFSFEWDPAKAALQSVEPRRAAYHWQGLDYGVSVLAGTAKALPNGWIVTGAKGKIVLRLAQAV